MQDRVYVPHKGDCEPVYDMGLNIFKKNVVKHPNINDRILKELLNLIDKERNGEVINRGLVKSITQMLFDLGINSRQVYDEEFEVYYLETSGNFYRNESQSFINTNSCPDYLIKVENRLKEEIDRVAHYLDSSTKMNIMEVVERELISVHMFTLLNNPETGFITMLREDQIEDLSRMYTLFYRIPNGLEAMKKKLNQYIKELGIQIIKANKSTEEKSSSRETFIPQLLKLKEKFDTLLEKAFKTDPSFLRELNSAFEEIINFTQESPEALSLFIDKQLRKGLKGANEDEIENTLNKSISIFRYIKDSDVFENYYKQHLAKRLLLNIGISDYAERNMIAKLKAECGYQFTSKLEGKFYYLIYLFYFFCIFYFYFIFIYFYLFLFIFIYFYLF